jgi:hypothetical protein
MEGPGANKLIRGRSELTRLYRSKSVHWKLTNSTTLTFATRIASSRCFATSGSTAVTAFEGLRDVLRLLKRRLFRSQDAHELGPRPCDPSCLDLAEPGDRRSTETMRRQRGRSARRRSVTLACQRAPAGRACWTYFASV